MRTATHDRSQQEGLRRNFLPTLRPGAWIRPTPAITFRLHSRRNLRIRLTHLGHGLGRLFLGLIQRKRDRALGNAPCGGFTQILGETHLRQFQEQQVSDGFWTGFPQRMIVYSVLEILVVVNLIPVFNGEFFTLLGVFLAHLLICAFQCHLAILCIRHCATTG